MSAEQPTFSTPNGRFWVLRSDDDVYEQRVEYAPGSPFPPLHHHPGQDEHFVVEHGAMLFVVDGAERTLGAGESIDIPAGAPHRARNASAVEPVTVRWVTTPALRTARFHAIAAQLGDDAGPLDQALFAHQFRDVFRADGTLRYVIPAVAWLARLLRRRLPRET